MGLGRQEEELLLLLLLYATTTSAAAAAARLVLNSLPLLVTSRPHQRSDGLYRQTDRDDPTYARTSIHTDASPNNSFS